MGRKKATEEKPEVIEKKPAKREKKPEAVENTPATIEVNYIYHTGDNIEDIAKLLTGRRYMAYRLLEVNGLTMNSLKDGAILKWGV